MAPARKHVGRDKFGALFSALKTHQYIEPPSRNPVATVHRTISWNVSGGLIATGANDKTIRIWNPERTNSKSQTELRGHNHTVDKISFNPVREFELASCSSDGVRFWDTRSRACVAKLQVDGDPFTLTWSADGSVLLAGTKASLVHILRPILTNKDDHLVPISTAIPSSPTVLARHKQERQTNQTAFSHVYPPRDLIITQGDGTVKILDYPSFNILHSLPAHTSSCLAISYAPDGKHVAVGGSDAMISLWDTTDWICKRTMTNPNSGSIRGLSWSWDGRYVVGACEDNADTAGGGGMDIYHAESGDVVATIPNAPAVEWHPNQYWLAYTQVDSNRKGGTSLKIVGAPGGAGS